jgi:hypothetical protein
MMLVTSVGFRRGAIETVHPVNGSFGMCGKQGIRRTTLKQQPGANGDHAVPQDQRRKTGAERIGNGRGRWRLITGRLRRQSAGRCPRGTAVATTKETRDGSAYEQVLNKSMPIAVTAKAVTRRGRLVKHCENTESTPVRDDIEATATR